MFCLAEHIEAVRKYVKAFKSAFLIAGGGPQSDMALSMLDSFMVEVDALWMLHQSSSAASGQSTVVVDAELLGVDFTRRADSLPDLVAPAVRQTTVAARALAAQAQNVRSVSQSDGTVTGKPEGRASVLALTNQSTAEAIVLQALALERMVDVLPVFFRAARIGHCALQLQ